MLAKSPRILERNAPTVVKVASLSFSAPELECTEMPEVDLCRI
jgi:hypothetical protein